MNEMEGNIHNGVSLLQDHAVDLLARAERAAAMGAMRAGIRAIMDFIGENPHLAGVARSTLAAHDEKLIAYIAAGNGAAIASIMERIVGEIRAQSDPLRGRGLSTPPKLDRAAPGSVKANFRPSGEILFTDDQGKVVERREQ
jgi:hypothetical protein